ncbi:MAG: DUF1905 domain-containing protein [Candidatus Kerfeldbacteria bacterium]|nr:DUF1905 domain-containing protein [Candidatus Kerfeldbacteria bacterium]
MTSNTIYKFKGKVWVWQGEGAWHFVSLPKDKSTGIRKLYHGLTGGFGSLPVKVTIGKTTWKTSIFPESKAGQYMLPLKKDVRKAENFSEGDVITYKIQVLI